MEFIVAIVFLGAAMLFIGFMRGISAGPSAAQKTAGANPAVVSETVIGRIRGDGSYQQEVVGESNYQKALSDIARRIGGSGPWEADAVLRIDNDNKYDDQAVAVHIGPKVVGYLSKKDARRYRKQLSDNGLEIGNYEVGAKIFGGTDGKSFGVWLDFEIV